MDFRRIAEPRLPRPTAFRARVVSSRPLTPTTHAITVEKPGSFSFLPTQFTFLQLLTEAGVDARPMSLASAPTREHLEYAVRLSDSSFKRAFAELEPGNDVAVFGPIGNFVLDEKHPAVLIAGGIGVTPLKGMAEYAADVELPTPIRLVYSSRDETEIAYRDELSALERRNPHFRVLHTLTRDYDAGWPGSTGRISRALLEQASSDLEYPIYYISGTTGMVVGTLRLLREMGTPGDSIEVEAFRGYR